MLVSTQRLPGFSSYQACFLLNRKDLFERFGGSDDNAVSAGLLL